MLIKKKIRKINECCIKTYMHGIIIPAEEA